VSFHEEEANTPSAIPRCRRSGFHEEEQTAATHFGSIRGRVHDDAAQRRFQWEILEILVVRWLAFTKMRQNARERQTQYRCRCFHGDEASVREKVAFTKTIEMQISSIFHEDQAEASFQ